MQKLYEKEIHELHSFFEAWYQGRIENTDHEFSRLEGVLAPEFTLITPDGHVVERDQLVAMMRSEYGTKPDIKMWVENCRLRFADDNIFVVIYEEHGVLKERKKASLITAILRKNPSRKNKLDWIHIHEVEIPA